LAIAALALAAALQASGQTGDLAADVVIEVPGAQASRVPQYRSVADEAVETIAAWLGPLPTGPLRIVAVPWSASAVPPDSATILVPHRWLSLRGDRSVDRFVVAGLARHYWFDGVRFAPAEAWLAAGLVRYTAARLAHDVIDGDHYRAPSFFGDTLAYPVRRAPQSIPSADTRPYLRTFDEIDRVLADLGPTRVRAERVSRALQTLERYTGWPILASAVGVFARRFHGRDASLADFEAVCEDVMGRELSWFFASAFRPDARYDYGVGDITATAAEEGRHALTVTVRRFGEAVFSGSARPSAALFDEGRAIELVVTFADGAEVREVWDGRDESRTFRFVSRAPAVDVVLDPDAVLLLDEDWGNNRRVLSGRVSPTTLQWSLLWAAWLQGLMLTLTTLT
jgi:hypothetical protein